MSKILITSALPYINGIKHLGNLVGSMLPADVYARYMRMTGNDVLFICATDEHGTPAELGAVEKGQSTEAFCEEQHNLQEEIYQKFNLSFDFFGRSSAPQNHELTKHFAEKLEANGYIEEREIKQVYSLDDNRFLPDRYIIGTCPYCGYEAARGDQCENCTKLLDPTELINPRSAVSGSSRLEVKMSKHLFLKLPLMEETLRKWINSKFEWPQIVTSIAKKWLDEGLHERCITRDLNWGVSVPKEGYEGKVFYVWFDAPIAYISATKQWSDQKPDARNYKDWWQGGDDVKYVQFMAKDNIPFHTIIFPATIFGSDENWKQPDYIKGFNWLTFYGGKFSTSSKRGIFTNQALSEFPADYWRYWLMSNAPESSDSSFTFSSFAGTVNKDLNDVLGNFVSRVLKMTASKVGSFVPAAGDFNDDDKELFANLKKRIADYSSYLGAMEYRKALVELRAIWVEGNNYLTKAAPWTVIKTDEARAKTILNIAINLIRINAVLAMPIIPSTSKTILNALGIEAENIKWLSDDIVKEFCYLKEGHKFDVPEQIFQKIPQESIDELVTKYGGEETVS
ncbi:MAG: methionine--tRNA ligase [Alphaproteobacteria bacterium]